MAKPANNPGTGNEASGNDQADAIQRALSQAQASVRQLQQQADSAGKGTAAGNSGGAAGGTSGGTSGGAAKSPKAAAAQLADAAQQAQPQAADDAGAWNFDEDLQPLPHTDTGIELLGDVDLDVMIELGRTEMLVEDVLKLGEGSVVELDKLAGDPVDVYVNGRRIARGEVLVLNDQFCIRISEIMADLEKQAEAAAEQARAGVA
jgi:flagellar motor switch protein FliN/FliY